MKILVFGVGAIGSLMVHYLCEAGNDVTVVARSTYEELKNNGIRIKHYLQRKTTVDHPHVLKEADGAHYPHPQKAVNEMYRIIKKDGYLLLNDMDCVAPIRAVANIIFPRLKAGDVKMYNKKEILAMMKTAGFKKVKYRKISPFSFQCIARK